MPVYQVDIIPRRSSLFGHTVEEENATQAAERIAGRPVSRRALQPYWSRVVDAHEATVHEFSVEGIDDVKDFAK